MHVDWASEFRQAGDACQAAETASIAILEVPDGCKLCTACQEPQPADAEHFYRDKGKADGWSNLCKPCFGARQRRYSKASG